MSERDDERIEAGLFAAFRPAEGESVLESIARVHGAEPSVFLREAAEDATPVALRRPDDDAAKDDSRYQLLGEIARGGIGVVYKGRDKDLNRDIALKVLRPEFAERDDVIQRFIEEAQVGGQLQHPGIVPIYGIGMQHDGRPSFAMKLIKGRTLAEVLDSNADEVDLLAVFEQIVQTMAYAHSRGVIHRDLKPANIMIGAFGEVQVVDWGFAKVLGQAEPAKRPGQTLVATVRSGSEGSQSIAGSVMGTPAYMPPEQAMGQVDDLDERSDVFALGAILCEILTGKAPYEGEQKDQLIAASQCRMEPALERLQAADAPAGLKEITRACLQPLMGDRPRSGRVLADRLSAHFASVEERARESELAALASEHAAVRDQQARRRSLALAAVGLLAVLVGGGGFLLWQSDRDARVGKAAPRIAAAMREATGHEGKQEWGQAVEAAQRAVDIAASEGVDDAGAGALLTRLEVAKARAHAARKEREEDDRFLAELEEIRGRYGQVELDSEGDLKGETQDAAGTDAAYRAAFKKRFGALEAGEPALRASPHRASYAANLGYWAALRKMRLKATGWEALDRMARRVDPGHVDVRDALLAEDPDALLKVVGDRDDLPLALVAQVGRALNLANRHAASLAFLLPWFDRSPNDFWLNIRISVAARESGELNIAVRHATAAVAVRPANGHAWHVLARAFQVAGDLDDAHAAYRRSVDLYPQYAPSHNNLACLYFDRGDLEQAVSSFRKATALDANEASFFHNLGVVLQKQGDLEGAEAAARTAIALDPEFEGAHGNLGRVRMDRGDLDGAIEQFKRVIAINPKSNLGFANLGVAYLRKGEIDRSILWIRRAIAEDPMDAMSHSNLGTTLDRKGDTAGAERAFLRALEVRPDYARAHFNLGTLYQQLGRLDEAESAFRDCVRIAPRSAVGHAGLALVRIARGQREAGLEMLRRAAELDPSADDVYAMLGTALRDAGDARGAAEAFREAAKLQPSRYGHHSNLGIALSDLGDHEGAFAAHRRAVEIAPSAGWPRVNLGNSYFALGAVEKAMAEYRRAAELDPRLAVAHSNMGAAQAKNREFAVAVQSYRKAVAIDPEYVSAWAGLGRALLDQGKYEDALDPLRRAVRLDPRNVDPPFGLGVALGKLDRREEAVEAFRRVIELDPLHATAHNNLGINLFESGDASGALAAVRHALMLDANNKYAPKALRLILAKRYGPRMENILRGTDVPNEEERLGVAELLFMGREHAAALRFYKLAFEANPKLLPVHGYFAACAAVETGEEHHDQALVWLRGYLAWLSKQPARVARPALERWEVDDALSDVDPEMTDGLSDDWKQLWKQRAALQKKVGGIAR